MVQQRPPRRSLYDILGVRNTSSAREITQAYRRLARIHHPDSSAAPSATSSGDKSERFSEIANAYEVLSDADMKAQYDVNLRFPTSHAQRYADTTTRPRPASRGGFQKQSQQRRQRKHPQQQKHPYKTHYGEQQLPPLRRCAVMIPIFAMSFLSFFLLSASLNKPFKPNVIKKDAQLIAKSVQWSTEQKYGKKMSNRDLFNLGAQIARTPYNRTYQSVPIYRKEKNGTLTLVRKAGEQIRRPARLSTSSSYHKALTSANSEKNVTRAKLPLAN